MAKTNSLPSADGPPRPMSEAAKIVNQQLDADYSTRETEGYLPRRVDVKLTKAQAAILRDKFRKLQDSGAKTADGRFVTNRMQAVRWIIENEVQK